MKPRGKEGQREEGVFIQFIQSTCFLNVKSILKNNFEYIVRRPNAILLYKSILLMYGQWFLEIS